MVCYIGSSDYQSSAFLGFRWRNLASKKKSKLGRLQRFHPKKRPENLGSLCLRRNRSPKRVADHNGGFFVLSGVWIVVGVTPTNQVMQSFLWGSCKSQQCTPATESKLPIPRQSSQGRTCQVVDSSGWHFFSKKNLGVNTQQNGMMEPLASPSKKNPSFSVFFASTP